MNNLPPDTVHALGPAPSEAEEYESPEAALKELQRLGLAHGYSIIKSDMYPTKKALEKQGRGTQYANYHLFACAKSKVYKEKESDVHQSKKRKVQGTKKTKCPYRVKAIRLNDDGTRWGLRVIDRKTMHNHLAHLKATADANNRMRLQPPEVLKEIESMGKIKVADVISTLKKRYPDIHLIPRDVYNLRKKARVKRLKGKAPIHWLMDVSIPKSCVYLTNDFHRS